MSILGRKISAKAVAAVAVGLVFAALLPVTTKTPDREITLVVRGMAFYVDGDFTHPNPVIAVRAGENVRISVRNEARGITHDFAVPRLGEETRLLDWNEADAVSFEAPERPGTYEYVCNPHRAMMKGILKVD
jgi:plastocyanin